jgi:predicted esterase
MNYTHPIVVRIEKEHNYARPWHKKINAQQKYPNRLTRFLYLKNFPRHFLSKYPNAFSSRQDGTIEVGSPEDLKYTHFNVKEEPMEVDELNLVEQENTHRLAGDANHDDDDDDDELKKEEPLLDTSTWTQQMDRLYFRTLQIFQEHYITKLVYENLPNGPIRMVNLLENTSLQLRHSFGNIAGWDNELLVWLHNLFTTKLPMHDHLMDTYHEVMQYLSKRLPRLIDRFYPNPDRALGSIATTPITSAATTPVHPSSGGGESRPATGPRSRHSSMSHHQQQAPNYLTLEEDPAAKFVLENTRSMPRRLTSNPIILLVPSGPSMPSQPTSARMEYWKSLLSSMGQLINVNIPYRPEQTAQEILQVMKTSVRDKIRDTMRKKFNELRPLLLVGFNQGSLISVHCALDNPGQVAAIICLGFPMTALNGFRGDLDDPLLDLDIPILFVIGQMATTATIGAIERLRESMTRSDTGLVIVGGANDKLIMCYKKKLYDGVTQYHVDKSIAEEIYNFVNSIHMQPPEGYA